MTLDLIGDVDGPSRHDIVCPEKVLATDLPGNGSEARRGNDTRWRRLRDYDLLGDFLGDFFARLRREIEVGSAQAHQESYD